LSTLTMTTGRSATVRDTCSPVSGEATVERVVVACVSAGPASGMSFDPPPFEHDDTTSNNETATAITPPPTRRLRNRRVSRLRQSDPGLTGQQRPAGAVCVGQRDRVSVGRLRPRSLGDRAVADDPRLTRTGQLRLGHRRVRLVALAGVFVVDE